MGRPSTKRDGLLVSSGPARLERVGFFGDEMESVFERERVLVKPNDGIELVERVEASDV